MLRYSDDNGFLFCDGKLSNDVHVIGESDILDLLKLTEEDEAWAQRVREEVIYNKLHPNNRIRSDWTLDEFRIRSISGTVIQFPFGLIITFSSKRHIFRGENQVFPYSIPSLNRVFLNKKFDERDQVLYRAISNMRIMQFKKLLWRFNIIPYWEAKMSDLNYKALAQHYGFETHLLDLTNDFKTALFFATCKYVPENDSFRPLTQMEVDDYKFGMIFHCPDWRIDWNQSIKPLMWTSKYCKEKLDGPISVDSGLCDNIAFQIGYQPLYRCHYQSGYIYPMRNSIPLQEQLDFEKIKFPHSVELSQKVYTLMHEGKDVYPNEGISNVRGILDLIKETITFSQDDLELAYECDKANKDLFPTFEVFRKAIKEVEFLGKPVQISQEEIEYPITINMIEEVNRQYNNIDLLATIGGVIHQKYNQKEYRERRCLEIYGKLI